MFALALRLGKTLSELETSMTARELVLWQEYDKVSPISDIRGDIQSAQIATAVYRSQGGEVDLDDCRLQWAPGESGDDEALEALFKELAG